MSTAKRLTPNKIANLVMADEAWHDSEYVAASDYDALSAELAALRAERDALKTDADDVRAIVNELRCDAHEIIGDANSVKISRFTFGLLCVAAGAMKIPHTAFAAAKGEG